MMKNWIVLALLLVSPSLLVSSTKPKSSSSSNDNEPECGLYLAESTIPHAGLGMFAGKDFGKEDQVTQGDIVIPLIEVDWHNNDEDWNFLWDEYTWAKGDIWGMEEEIDASLSVSAASPGIGAAINCRISMANIEATWNKLDDAGLHRSKHPGAGAITPYHDRQSIAIDDIVAGQELYISYGEEYFRTRQSTYGLLPLPADFTRADALIETFCNILPKTDTISSATSLRQGLLDFLHLNYTFPSRTINALPTNVSDLDRLVDNKIGTAKQYQTTKSVQWLDKHGRCMDHIRPGASTIPGAGRGAFASRSLPRGTIVAPAPLIHIVNKTRMTMYDIALERTSEDNQLLMVPNVSAPIQQQLLVNYCFGHPKSSLLLSSYGMITNLINHSSKQPNVKLQWSNIFTSTSSNDKENNRDWRNFTLEELDKERHTGLGFEYVALKDIDEGEEILLDYGKEWEDAWNKHVQNWKPPPNAECYVLAHLYNDNADLIVRTFYERPQYSDNVLIYLHEEYRLMSGLSASSPKFRDWHRARILDRYQPSSLSSSSARYGTNNETVLYMVEIYHEVDGDGDDDDDKTFVEYDKEVLFGVPRDAFSFMDAPYSRDHFLKSSFRYPIMIPDDLMPKQWLNLP